MAEVDAEQGRGASARDLGGAQDRAVAAEHDDEFEVAGRDVSPRMATLPRATATRPSTSARSSRSSTGTAPAAISCSQTVTAGRERVGAAGVGDDEDVRVAVQSTLLTLPRSARYPIHPFCRIAARRRGQPAQVLVIAGGAGDRRGDQPVGAEAQVPAGPEHAGDGIRRGVRGCARCLRGCRRGRPRTAA